LGIVLKIAKMEKRRTQFWILSPVKFFGIFRTYIIPRSSKTPDFRNNI
jgi:hypothetical protein